jgi:hypothetical protein
MRWLPSTRTFVVVAGYVLGGFALFWGLPENVPPSWKVSAGRTQWFGGPMMAFLLPTAVAITDFLLRGLCVKHPVDEPNSLNVLAMYDAIMLRFTMFVMGVHGAVLLAVLGLLSGRWWAAQLVPADVGLDDDQHRKSSSENSPQPRDRHPHTPHAFGPCALDASAPLGGIYGRREWSGHCPVGDHGATTHWAGDDPSGWTSRTRGHLSSRPVREKARACLAVLTLMTATGLGRTRVLDAGSAR